MFDAIINNLEDRPILNSAFSWPGAKYKHIKILNDILPLPRTRWVDVFGGSGVVTINRPKSDIEILNDKDPDVYETLFIIKNFYPRLAERLRYTVCSREEFHYCKTTWRKCSGVERAARWLYMKQMSFSDSGSGWSRTLKTRAIKTIDVDSIIKMGERLRDVMICNQEAVELIKICDDPTTIQYLDPDYVGASALYNFTANHSLLLDTIQGCKSYFAVSNFRNKLYDSYPWDDVIEWEGVVSMNSKARRIKEALYVRKARAN